MERIDIRHGDCRAIMPTLEPVDAIVSDSPYYRDGFRSILIEAEEAYIVDINRRLGAASGADTPLFAE